MNAGQKCPGPLGLLRRSLRYPSSSTKPACMRYSTPTASIADSTISPEIAFNPVLYDKLAPTLPHRIASSIVISRPPMITRDMGEFEQSFYFYQRRLNDRLQLPFTRWFYFKKDTLLDNEWKRKQAAAGRYNPYGPRQWADELLVGDNWHKSDDNGYQYLVDTTVTGEEETMAAATVRVEAAKEAEMKGEAVESSTEIVAKPFPRASKADLENDTRSLNRKMSRTLYLLVKGKGPENAWRFPQSFLVGRENLLEGAERTLRDAAGINMHTWFVGNVPIGHHVYRYPKDYTDGKNIGMKIFFMKARILAGQADLTDNKLDIEDFQWLSKEEIEAAVEGKYFRAVRHMLVAR